MRERERAGRGNGLSGGGEGRLSLVSKSRFCAARAEGGGTEKGLGRVLPTFVYGLIYGSLCRDLAGDLAAPPRCASLSVVSR